MSRIKTAVVNAPLNDEYSQHIADNAPVVRTVEELDSTPIAIFETGRGQADDDSPTAGRKEFYRVPMIYNDTRGRAIIIAAMFAIYSANTSVVEEEMILRNWVMFGFLPIRRRIGAMLKFMNTYGPDYQYIDDILNNAPGPENYVHRLRAAAMLDGLQAKTASFFLAMLGDTDSPTVDTHGIRKIMDMRSETGFKDDLAKFPEMMKWTTAKQFAELENSLVELKAEFKALQKSNPAEAAKTKKKFTKLKNNINERRLLNKDIIAKVFTRFKFDSSVPHRINGLLEYIKWQKYAFDGVTDNQWVAYDNMFDKTKTTEYKDFANSDDYALHKPVYDAMFDGEMDVHTGEGNITKNLEKLREKMREYSDEYNRKRLEKQRQEQPEELYAAVSEKARAIMAQVTTLKTISGIEYKVNSTDEPTYFSAFVDGKKVAYMSLRPVYADGNQYCTIELVSVDPKFRKQGIARNLYNLALKTVVEAGYAGLHSYNYMIANKKPIKSIHKRLKSREIKDGDEVLFEASMVNRRKPVNPKIIEDWSTQEVIDFPESVNHRYLDPKSTNPLFGYYNQDDMGTDFPLEGQPQPKLKDSDPYWNSIEDAKPVVKKRVTAQAAPPPPAPAPPPALPPAPGAPTQENMGGGNNNVAKPNLDSAIGLSDYEWQFNIPINTKGDDIELYKSTKNNRWMYITPDNRSKFCDTSLRRTLDKIKETYDIDMDGYIDSINTDMPRFGS